MRLCIVRAGLFSVNSTNCRRRSRSGASPPTSNFNFIFSSAFPVFTMFSKTISARFRQIEPVHPKLFLLPFWSPQETAYSDFVSFCIYKVEQFEIFFLQKRGLCGIMLMTIKQRALLLDASHLSSEDAILTATTQELHCRKRKWHRNPKFQFSELFEHFPFSNFWIIFSILATQCG